jgi:hypothetical protein
MLPQFFFSLENSFACNSSLMGIVTVPPTRFRFFCRTIHRKRVLLSYYFLNKKNLAGNMPVHIMD